MNRKLILPNKIIQTSKGAGNCYRHKRAIALWLKTVVAILQAGAAIGGMLIKGINALVDAKRVKSFNNTLKMVAANVELAHQRLMTLENRTSMMAKAIMPALDDLKNRIAYTNQKLTLQYRMMQMAHHKYNLLLRWTHEMLTIHHFTLLLPKNYLAVQVGTLQRIHCQCNRYQSALDDTLIGIESLSSRYLTHRISDPKTI